MRMLAASDPETATACAAARAEAAIVLAEERLGYDEYQMTVLLFWRADEAVS